MGRCKDLLDNLLEFYMDDGFKNAAGLLFQYQNEVFLLKRSKEVSDPGVWSIPGGMVEGDETPFQTAMREAREELGQVPGFLNTGKISEYNDPDRNLFYSTHLIEAEKRFDEAMLNWESESYGWFNKKDLPENMHPGLKKAIKDFGF